MKKKLHHSVIIKYFTFVLLFAHLGVSNISLSYLFLDVDRHQIELSKSIESNSVLEDIQKEVEDNFNMEIEANCNFHSLQSNNNNSSVETMILHHAEISTPPPEII